MRVFHYWIPLVYLTPSSSLCITRTLLLRVSYFLSGRCTLPHPPPPYTDPTCSFLTDQEAMAEDGTWMSDGCSLVATASSSNVTVCECYHLTSFALLMSPTGETVSHAVRSLHAYTAIPPLSPTQPSDPVLQIVSKVGLCISIICLLLTIIMLFCLK